MVKHDFHFKDVRPMLRTDLGDYILQPVRHFFGKHLTPVFGTPNDVILAGVDNVVVGLEVSIPHASIIPQGAI
jgi:hypothetical protein